MPSSHQITIPNPICTDSEKGSDETLITFLFAYIYGTRLMPSKWRFDGRIPIKPANHIYVTDNTILHFFEHVYTWWKTLTENQRIKFINILYVFNRARSLEWDWDTFFHQYVVFDALYKFHLELHPNRKAKNHLHRFKVLCEEYSVFNVSLINNIYTTRNELFHEAMWANSMIGFGSQNRDAHQLPFHLARLNERIISGITGYKNGYIRTPWWCFGAFEFDKM